jgi:hypothetical protein
VTRYAKFLDTTSRGLGATPWAAASANLDVASRVLMRVPTLGSEGEGRCHPKRYGRAWVDPPGVAGVARGERNVGQQERPAACLNRTSNGSL